MQSTLTVEYSSDASIMPRNHCGLFIIILLLCAANLWASTFIMHYHRVISIRIIFLVPRLNGDSRHGHDTKSVLHGERPIICAIVPSARGSDGYWPRADRWIGSEHGTNAGVMGRGAMRCFICTNRHLAESLGSLMRTFAWMGLVIKSLHLRPLNTLSWHAKC